MKKVSIILCIITAALLQLCCTAQGNVNSNNGLGAPYGETQDPYSSELSDYTTMPDKDAATGTGSALLKVGGDDARNGSDAAAAVAVIVLIVIMTAGSVAVFAAMKKRGEE